jgi:hypothetical protein
MQDRGFYTVEQAADTLDLTPGRAPPADATRRRLDGNVAHLAGDLCRILRPNFGEYPFHALRRYAKELNRFLEAISWKLSAFSKIKKAES